MNTQAQGIFSFFPVLFVGTWIAVTTLLGFISGWLRLQKQYPAQSEPSQLTLRMRSSGFGGVRHHMMCPIAARPCEVLHLVDGMFASRQAHRLTYWSQCEDELGRARRKVIKPYRRLCGDQLYARVRGRHRYQRVQQCTHAEVEARMLYRARLARAMGSSNRG